MNPSSPPRPRAQSPIDDEGFEIPSWDTEVSAEALLRVCPAQMKTRGVFFRCLCDEVRKDQGYDPPALFHGISRRQWATFQAYSLHDFIQLAYNAAGLLRSVRSRSDGLRQLGWRACSAFASTMAGRVVLYALGDEFDNVLQVAHTVYEVVLPGSRVRSRRLAPRHWRLEMREVYSFVGHLQFGVLEGAVREHGHQPRIRVRHLSRECDADFDVRW